MIKLTYVELVYNHRSAGPASSLLSPLWSGTGSGLWLACPGSLSESQRSLSCDLDSALCTTLYVWPAHMKLNWAYFYKHDPEPPKSPPALNRRTFGIYFVLCLIKRSLFYSVKSNYSYSIQGIIIYNMFYSVVDSFAVD